MKQKPIDDPDGLPPSLARRPGESEMDHCRRVAAWISGEDVRTRTDLVGWTGSLPFHLNREPIK